MYGKSAIKRDKLRVGLTPSLYKSLSSSGRTSGVPNIVDIAARLQRDFPSFYFKE